MSFLTGTNTELIYASTGAGTAKNTFTSEVTINDAAMGVQCHLPPDFWLPSPTSVGRGIRLVARGYLSSTGTPTYQWTVRGGTAGSITSAILFQTAALTTGSGVTNQHWELEGDFVVTAMGQPGANSTGQGLGKVMSPGLAAPYVYPASAGGSGSVTTTTTSLLDTSITNFINVNVTCSASSASNAIRITQLLVYGLN